MKKVAITGGIGSGKTYISNMFAELGVPIYDSDSRAKKIINSNIQVKKSITSAFGLNCFNGSILDRRYISNLIFNDRSKLKLINSIVHPFVYMDYNCWLLKQKFNYTIYESAIIYDNQGQYNFDKIIGVISEEELRISRLLDRGMDNLSITNIMKNQMPDSKIVSISDFLIYNNLNNELTEDVKGIHSKLLLY
ncbi:dephospho-CoA kinase [Flavobacteriaceae bacterium]|jgi:dephospho-CoA kinase|nr:dephospho-CoA kinase [Flavobacteriaceae bacterium]MDC1492387.1 dephospho-CoA kinase [Flavobacteriaceae bacterium]